MAIKIQPGVKYYITDSEALQNDSLWTATHTSRAAGKAASRSAPSNAAVLRTQPKQYRMPTLMIIDSGK